MSHKSQKHAEALSLVRATFFLDNPLKSRMICTVSSFVDSEVVQEVCVGTNGFFRKLAGSGWVVLTLIFSFHCSHRASIFPRYLKDLNTILYVEQSCASDSQEPLKLVHIPSSEFGEFCRVCFFKILFHCPAMQTVV